MVSDGSPVWVAFTPRDAVQVRDGRTFGVGDAAQTRRPQPSTIAGAVGAAYRGRVREVRGPVPVFRVVPSRRWQAVFPLPADIVPTDETESRWLRLTPSEDSPVGTDLDPDGVLRLLDTGHPVKGAARDCWLDASDLERYLHLDEFTAEEMAPIPGPYVSELRTGIAREGRTVRDSHLYSSGYLRLRETPRTEWALAAQCLLFPHQAEPSGPVRFGGEARLADVSLLDPGPEWPAAPEGYPGGRVLLYLATPGIWRRRDGDGSVRTSWRPPLPPGAELCAAALTGPEPISTASPVEGTGRIEGARLRWAVPAGTVYLIQFTGADPEAAAAAWAGRVHGRALPAAIDDKDTEGALLSTAGFGIALTGRWR
ncbi:MAG TPA: type III-B CRISPR module-associated protein Cmr3 [Thermobifida alba]|nr:type III-B CRISPR module-associated protein Cmr3 [Thermobifida alba]